MSGSGRSEEPEIELEPEAETDTDRLDRYLDPRRVRRKRRERDEPERDDSPFRQRIVPALMYPVRGPNAIGFFVISVILTFAFVGAIVMTMLLPLMILLVLPAVLLVYMWFIGWMFEVLRESAAGVAELPSLPLPSDFWDNLVVPFVLFVSVNIVCFGPAMAVSHFLEHETLANALSWIGWAILPMALLLTVLFETPLAMRPTVMIRGIWRTLGGYGVVLIATSLLPTIGIVVVDAAGWWGLLLFVPVMAYVFAVDMRLLGQLYHAHRRELGWVVE